MDEHIRGQLLPGHRLRVQVREGWSWHESAALLKGWASTLWQTNERLHAHSQGYRHAQGRTNVTRGLGLLDRSWVELPAQEESARLVVGGRCWWCAPSGESRAPAWFVSAAACFGQQGRTCL